MRPRKNGNSMMADEYDFDLFTIGAGSGGVRASRVAAAHGARVAVAERSEMVVRALISMAREQRRQQLEASIHTHLGELLTSHTLIASTTLDAGTRAAKIRARFSEPLALCPSTSASPESLTAIDSWVFGSKAAMPSWV
jgi:NADPH-dependent 2,4-dienoyl-CoA reductase/sulfur reductase-like enzyme